jgi:ribonuclease BN (tRNA processing enzyme)
MKIKVLGCSAVELPKSNLTSFLIDRKILLDAGTIGTALDESAQWKIKHVFLTHAHLDHIKDIPFFADSISMHNKNHSVTVMSIPSVIRALKKNLFNDIVWPDFTKIPNPEKPIIRLKSIETGKTFRIDSYSVTAYRVTHSAPAVGYLIEDGNSKRLLYNGDLGPSDAIWKSLKNIRIHGLITEVSFPNRLKNLAIKTGHLTPGLLALELKKIDMLPERIFVAHCKPKYRESVNRELGRLNIRNIKLLRDGAHIEL